VRNKTIRHLRWVAPAALLALGSCQSIKDNLEDCVQGIDLRFYSKTVCDADTLYPAAIDELRLYVFDDRGLLAAHGTAEAVRMRAEYTHTLEVQDGWFTVVAWAGLDAGTFDVAAPRVGVTTKDELLFRLRRTEGRAAQIGEGRVYYGESQPVFLPDPKEHGSLFRSASVNLLEQTNRIHVEVEGLPSVEEYEIVIESAAGATTYDGETTVDEPLVYASEATAAGTLLTASFTILQLELGMETMLVVRERATGRELYRGDLLGTLLLKNPGVNPLCQHDFTIRFTTQDQCQCGTYMVMQIWVNDWLVHSFDTDLE
jgi:hypothetical protein